MTTLYAPDPCEPPLRLTEPSLHDFHLAQIIRKLIPYAEYVEYGTRTNAELRNLIKQARAATGEVTK